jgi:hypothetical protein
MKNISSKYVIDKLFKDKHGKIVVGQFPNIPLAAWGFFSVIDIALKHGKIHTSIHELAQAWLFVWAYLELKTGDSLFRQILGGLVLLSVVMGFFQ